MTVKNPDSAAFHAKYPNWLENPKCLLDMLEMFEESGYVDKHKFANMKMLIEPTALLIELADEEQRDASGLKACIKNGATVLLNYCDPDPKEFIRSMVHHERLPPKKRVLFGMKIRVNEFWFFTGCIVLGAIIAIVVSLNTP